MDSFHIILVKAEKWGIGMPRQKKEAKILNIKLATSIYEKLEIFCDETGMSKTVATEKILDQYLERYLQKPESERKLFF